MPKILEEGTEVVNRTGTNTIKVPSHHFHFDLSQEFPILTTKQLFIRQAVLEMMWIYQAQSMMFAGYRSAMLKFGMNGKLTKRILERHPNVAG